MGPFLALLVIILVALLVVRIGSSALQLTGVSKSISQFQAASAFFGVGFTTAEAERVVAHPVRRRIILHLIIAGNIGLTSALATLLVTFMESGERGIGMTFMWLAVLVLVGLAVGILSNQAWIRRPLDRFLRASLKKAGLKRIVDYDFLLSLREGFCVSDGEVKASHPWVGKRLGEVRPSEMNTIVLGIHREDGDFVGAPTKDSIIHEKDTLLLYGPEVVICEILEGKMPS